MKTENIKFKAKELGTGKWKEGFLQRDMDYNLCILIAKKKSILGIGLKLTLQQSVCSQD